MATSTNNTDQGYWFTHIGEIRYENERAGQHWFSPESLRWFGSRIGRTVYGGRYFITSEQDTYGAWSNERRYTIRVADARGNIDTVGEFGQYATSAEARRAVLAIVKQEGRA